MLHFPGDQRFAVAAIGVKRYRSTLVTLSRACSRLEQRGLVTRLRAAHSHWAAVAITDKGREWLTVNTRQNYPPINR
jgi:hypothetical protein